MLLAVFLFLAILIAVLYLRPGLVAGSIIILVALFLLTGVSSAMWWLLLPTLLPVVLLNSQELRLHWLSRPAYAALQKVMPPMSETERAALEAGTTWWEKELFSGRPDWQQYAAFTLPTLTAKEQSFLDNEVVELCALIDEWGIHERQDLSPETWEFLRSRGFFGLIIPEQYGGRDFSPYAQSRVMSMLASRSITAAVTAMVPNSLGPGELLMKYGTQEQKQRWLPSLANGTELPCFGLTGPEVGSDAGAIPDTGIVCRGEHDGEEVLGLRMNFNKRWITLAPVATVVGLAFQLRDPDGLLGDPNIVDYGITCALLPANHPGVKIGERHNPGAPFMNGPVSGVDVFIPLDWIIGGAAMAGKGWRMLIECLAAGRGVSLPSLATAGAEKCYVTVGAYARIRKQFGLEVGKFEGVQEATAEIAAGAYTLEAMRQFVTGGLAYGAPSVLTAMAKYHSTETMRTVVNHGMDVVSGRAIQLGPRNFLAGVYHALPVAITVEGANILTRSLMIFGQGAVRCHPYLYEELQALQHDDKTAGLEAFDPLFIKHIGHVASNAARVLVLGLTAATLGPVPSNTNEFGRRWYQRIDQLSAALATCADVALGVLAGDLKRRELLSARLGDVHSQLVIACSILKYHEAQPAHAIEDSHAEFALTLSLYRAQEALLAFCRNFPSWGLGLLLRVLCLPLGRVFAPPTDDQIRALGDMIMQPTRVRARLAESIYVGENPEDSVGRLESTYQLLLQVEERWDTFHQADKIIAFKGESLAERLRDAVDRDVIEEADVEVLLGYDSRRYDALLTDHFEHL